MAWYREFSMRWATIHDHGRCSNSKPDPGMVTTITSSNYRRKCMTYKFPEYSTKFIQILSMSLIDMPEIVKHWFYQQNLRADTSSYVAL
ncbi:Hypothetical protein PHPALM_3757 [Phytophthora palmivora]|uniref:Uncharacterized protein n=1 Tax=Phytophthora palmivora TaxID=4796 RepID=A0A2P4YLL3_9STRA|nr:Hypothetical protein PHPALM_3757 [Phytophthora palmivora]